MIQFTESKWCKKNQINNIINYGLENLNNLEEWSKDETLRNLIF